MDNLKENKRMITNNSVDDIFCDAPQRELDIIIYMGKMFLEKYENSQCVKGLTKALRDLLEDLKANAVGLSMYDLFGYKSTLQEIQENIEFIIKGSCTEEPYAATVWRSDPITPLVRSAECILAIFEDGVRPDFVRWNYEKEMWVDPYNSSIEYRKKDPWKWAEIIISLSPKAINRRPFCLSGYYI